VDTRFDVMTGGASSIDQSLSGAPSGKYAR
jgi:hypothetical protein